MSHDYPHLHHFLGAYFHQDWTLEDRSADEVLARFRRENDDDTVSAVKRELVQLLASGASDDELSRTVSALGCEYYAPADGWSYGQWLEHVREQL